ncbi:hypothetical protein A5320_04185 [Rheinheimera sp. SA_1]|uniref:hypothetical protein n=1 Tax=Rheinheimera sp. SA_1 TaxID=1827365 RepID=UPI0007FC5643|nr:hypothetical protein [Rheinheimera sp. SA_1]OBP16601.1 hypothetical protein A5320_04185 [Rheinheimera sp. SA_1]
MNPLHTEYKRSQLRTFIVVLCLAFSAAVFDYFIALNQRIAQQQNLLNSAVEDLEHQFSPLLHLMTVLKADAELSLLAEQPSDASKPLTGMLWSVVAEQPDATLSDAEVAMLQQLMPKLQHSQRSTVVIRQFSYVSNSGVWYSTNDGRTAAQELQSELYWEQKQQQHKLGLPDIRLHKVDAAEAIFLLAIPLQKKEQHVGELLLELDLAFMLKLVAKAQQGARVQLMNDVGQALLTVEKMQVVPVQPQDLIHHSDNLKSLEQLNLTLHLEPVHIASVSSELMSFMGHVLLYLATLMLLAIYLRRRFKTKVLSPFHRLLVHIERLRRGDIQGVRNIPADWGQVFQQVEQIRTGTDETQNKR